MSLGQIKQYLSYDPETGVFTWIKKTHVRGNGPKAGDVAGCLNKSGYVVIRFKGTLYLAHRLAWFFVYGETPERLDHRNRLRSDNRIENLRPVTSQQNSANSEGKENSLSGYKGVQSHENGRHYAYIVVDRKKIHLGGFDTTEEAARAYDAAARTHFGEHARLNFGV